MLPCLCQWPSQEHIRDHSSRSSASTRWQWRSCLLSAVLRSYSVWTFSISEFSLGWWWNNGQLGGSERSLLTWEAGQAWWLTPVIQALWRPKWADYLRSGVQDQPDQHGETPSKKNEKLCFLLDSWSQVQLSANPWPGYRSWDKNTLSPFMEIDSDITMLQGAWWDCFNSKSCQP